MAVKRKLKNEEQKALDIAAAISAVTKEKNINIELVLDSLKDAISSAAKKLQDFPTHIEVEIDREKGTIKAYTLQLVVDQVEDPEKELWLEDAKDIDPDLEIGDEVVEELDITKFGRAAIASAKQIIIQRVREHEREKIFNDFTDRIGELVTGTVQQIEKGNILVNLGRTEAIMPFREQIRKERYHQGDTIKACILEVRNNIKGPQVVISRCSPEFVERLFEIEVPEIYERIVRIIKVVRAPGYRAKIAVTTTDSRVDPVGACVGMRGNRVQAIVRELSNERMDIVHWSEDITLLARRVFNPTEVRKIIQVGEDKLVVLVADEDLAIAIGKEGQNIRLAARLIGKDLDVYGEDEFADMSDEQREKILTAGEKSADDEDFEDEDDLDEVPAVETAQDDESGEEEAVKTLVEDAASADVENEFTADEESVR